MKVNRIGQRSFAAITYVLIACFTLTSCSFIRSALGIGNGNEEYEEIGGDWHVWRSYSDELVLSDSMSICVSSLDERNGYAVYNAYSGDRIGSLILPEPLSLDDIVSSGFEIEDYNGDGLNDIGIKTTSGTVIQYLYIPDGNGLWPEDIGGCFTRVDTE